MLSLLLIVCNFIDILNAQNYCIWGKTETNSLVNGLYTYDGVHNGQPSYIKTIGAQCAAPTLYLWNTVAGNAWRISDTKGSDNFNMQCSQSDLSSCTTNRWGAGNEAVFAQADSCPLWDCTSITIPSNTFGNCDGPFDTKQGDNAWSSSANRYWYFAPHMFMWVCNDALEPATCPTSFFARSNIGWTDLQPGANINLDLTDTAASPTTASYQINCLGTKSPTSSPVPIPTSSPNNTPNPTSSPIGTNIPTSNPVSVPVGTSGSVCIWGRNDANFFNTALNGLYLYDGDLNGQPSYKKTIDCTTGLINAYLYMNGANTQWSIGDTKGSASNYANCAQTDISLCSAGQWQAVLTNGGGFETEPNLFAQKDSCPSWDCAAVSSTDPNTNCRSFNTQIDVNTWSSADGFVWWFDPTMFMWKCIDINTDTNYDQCQRQYSAATVPQLWAGLSSGQNTPLTYSFSNGPTTNAYTLSCSGIGFPSPTAATAGPTALTPAPNPAPSTSPIQPGAPTRAPAKSPTGAPIKSPSTSPIQPGSPTKAPAKSPTGAPVISPTDAPVVPGSPTRAPIVPTTAHPTLPGTAKPTTGAPTDDNGTSRPTQPTTKAPTSPGSTNWDCVGIANSDHSDLNGNYQKLSSLTEDRSAYELSRGVTKHYLYWMYWPTEDKYFWVITQVLGSNSDRIFGYCHEWDIAQCSGTMLINGQVDTNVIFCNCANGGNCGNVGLPTVTPTNSDGSSGGGGGKNDGSGSGLTTMWIIIIIAIIVVACCCCIFIILICCAVLKKKKKKKATKSQFGGDEDKYGDTVKMNAGPQYTDPYSQQQIYNDATL